MTSNAQEGNTTASDPSRDLLRSLTEDISRLVRDELRKARDETAAKAKRAARASALLGGAGLLGALAAGTSAAVVVRALGRVLPRTAAGALATGLYGGGAVVLAVLGQREIRRVGTLVPAGVRQDVDAAASGVAAGSTPT